MDKTLEIKSCHCLTEEDKSIEQIAKELDVMSNRIEPILNGLVLHKIISKNENGYYLDEYKDVLLKDSKFNQIGYINFAQTINVSKKYKSVTGTMIDLPQVSKIQNRNIEKENLQDRLKSVSCDYNNNFPNGFFDDVFLFAIVHQESEENLKKLLNNIYNVLKANGRLFLTSFFLNDDKISPEFSVQFAIEMIVNSQNGKVYTHSEINNLLENYNFSNIERIDEIPSPATLYLARK